MLLKHYDTKKNTQSKGFVALCSKEFVALCVALCGVGSWNRRSWGQIFMRQKVFLKRNIVLPHTQWQGDVENYNWYVPLDKPKQNKTHRWKKGTRIEIASFSEWLANRSGLFEPSASSVNCLTGSLYAHVFPKMLRIPALDHNGRFVCSISPPCVLMSVDSRRGWKFSLTDGLNSTVAKFCREFFGFGAKNRSFLEKKRTLQYSIV